MSFKYEDAIENYCKSLKIKETAKGYRALGILLWNEDYLIAGGYKNEIKRFDG